MFVTNEIELNKIMAEQAGTRGRRREKNTTRNNMKSSRNSANRIGKRVECASAYISAEETQTMMATMSKKFSILHNKHIIHDSIETCLTKLLLPSSPPEFIRSVTGLCVCVSRRVEEQQTCCRRAGELERARQWKNGNSQLNLMACSHTCSRLTFINLVHKLPDTI